MSTQPGQSLKFELPKRISEACDALASGKFIILVDSEDRENEGDLVLAADFVDAKKMNFLIREACGLVCLALTPEQIERLGLPPMVQNNETSRQTAFTVSIEARDGVDTGISAADRARTIQVAANPNSKRTDVISPGHIFPLRSVEGGVLARPGHTEGSVDLCRIAGLNPAAVICEIMNEDGSMARMNDLEAFSKKHSIPILTIQELIEFRKKKSKILETESVPFPTRLSKNDQLEALAFRSDSGVDHLVLKTKNISSVPWVRIHSECLTGDVFGSERCDCGPQLHFAVNTISEKKDGMIIYLKGQEGRGIGLLNKLRTYRLQDQGMDTIQANESLGFCADERNFNDAAEYLKANGINKIRLITQNPQKKIAMESYGIEVVEVLGTAVAVSDRAEKYLQTKKERLGHWIIGKETNA